ncbi:hypothetical protein [Spirillospora sp. NPDC029432]|uniref:hypothetical protein n=1 Tax=Spirillospora sp. NPDC029432 TaxID=3154599 RepID=UPI003456391E
MSGPGWNDPYNQGWNDPNQGYGGYGGQGPGYGYGPPGVPNSGGGAPGSTIAALVCTSVATAMCCNILAIPGIVTSAMALNRHKTDPRSARSLTMWSWVIFGAAMFVYLAAIIVAAVIDARTPDYYDTSGI